MLSNTYPYSQQKKNRINDFIQKHRLLLLILSIIICSILITLFFIMLSTPKDTEREIEDPPYITTQTNYLTEIPFIGNDAFFNLSIILLSVDELESAPLNNPEGNNYIVSITNKSYDTINNDNIAFYVMDIDISDGRKYLLKILFSVEYNNEYAVMILDRTDRPEKDYVITFTNNTSEYYMNLGTNNTTSSSSITDYITGAPLMPVPEYAVNWINSLNLTTPETIHTTLPSIR